MRKLFAGITIPNAICFTRDRSRAFFADTATGQVMQVALDAEGWPEGEASVFIDLTAEGSNPDGAVIDAEGVMWMAQWGAARVAAYAPDGRLLRAVPLPAQHVTCPAFGGAGLNTLYVTSATQGLDAKRIAEVPQQGMTFRVSGTATGVAVGRTPR